MWPLILTGTFYGYFFSMFGRQAAASSWLDSFCSPAIDYYPARKYEPKPEPAIRSVLLVTTVRLTRNLADENDSRPSRPRDPDTILPAQCGRECPAQYGAPYTGGMGLRYYDLGRRRGPDGFRQ
jgi:hypothetical protein